MSGATLAAYDKVTAALCLWRESRSHPQAYAAIFHVILNRRDSGRFRATLHGVVLQPQQFSSFNQNDPNAYKFPIAASNYMNEWRAFEEACRVVDNPGSDPTHGATHYHSAPTDPYWARGHEPCLNIGPFKFYNTVK